jgi:phosphatidylserine decarboxylase
MFESWADYLNSFNSTDVLHKDKDGWFSADALQKLVQDFKNESGETMKFEEIFNCDPSDPTYGYKSFDDFFNRTLKTGIRPVQFPDHDDVINAACEAVYYSHTFSAKPMDEFWIKGEPYSLNHMLNNDPDYAESFEGGTVYQGFLQVTGYHRWHSPVTGVIKKIITVPGTYFAQSPAVLGEKENPYVRSLAFITSITTRMLIFIESDNPSIGLMCFIAIGMTEISTCEATAREGQRVTRGDEIGMFHFGGSSNVLAFRPETKLTFFNEAIPTKYANVGIRTALAHLTK